MLKKGGGAAPGWMSAICTRRPSSNRVYPEGGRECRKFNEWAAQAQVSLRLDSMGLVFPPGAPLRRGGVYPLKAGGAERRRASMARRDVGPRKELVPRPLTPHISASCVPQKGGLLGSSCTRMWPGEWPGNAREPRQHWRKRDDWRRVGPVSRQGPRTGW